MSTEYQWVRRLMAAQTQIDHLQEANTRYVERARTAEAERDALRRILDLAEVKAQELLDKLNRSSHD